MTTKGDGFARAARSIRVTRRDRARTAPMWLYQSELGAQTEQLLRSGWREHDLRDRLGRGFGDHGNRPPHMWRSAPRQHRLQLRTRMQGIARMTGIFALLCHLHTIQPISLRRVHGTEQTKHFDRFRKID